MKSLHTSLLPRCTYGCDQVNDSRKSYRPDSDTGLGNNHVGLALRYSIEFESAFL